MIESVMRVVTAYKRRFVRKLKRRSPAERLKSRRYYRANKNKIRIQRRRYLRKNRLFMRSRKLFKRVKPSWLSPKKTKPPTMKSKRKAPKRHTPVSRPRKINIAKPPKPRARKAHVPKRRTPSAPKPSRPRPRSTRAHA